MYRHTGSRYSARRSKGMHCRWNDYLTDSPRGYRSLVSCETILTARLKQITDDWLVRRYERSKDLALAASSARKQLPLHSVTLDQRNDIIWLLVRWRSRTAFPIETMLFAVVSKDIGTLGVWRGCPPRSFTSFSTFSIVPPLPLHGAAQRRLTSP